MTERTKHNPKRVPTRPINTRVYLRVFYLDPDARPNTGNLFKQNTWEVCLENNGKNKGLHRARRLGRDRVADWPVQKLRI